MYGALLCPGCWGLYAHPPIPPASPGNAGAGRVGEGSQLQGLEPGEDGPAFFDVPLPPRSLALPVGSGLGGYSGQGSVRS